MEVFMKNETVKVCFESSCKMQNFFTKQFIDQLFSVFISTLPNFFASRLTLNVMDTFVIEEFFPKFRDEFLKKLKIHHLFRKPLDLICVEFQQFIKDYGLKYSLEIMSNHSKQLHQVNQQLLLLRKYPEAFPVADFVVFSEKRNLCECLICFRVVEFKKRFVHFNKLHAESNDWKCNYCEVTGNNMDSAKKHAKRHKYCCVLGINTPRDDNGVAQSCASKLETLDDLIEHIKDYHTKYKFFIDDYVKRANKRFKNDVLFDSNITFMNGNPNDFNSNFNRLLSTTQVYGCTCHKQPFNTLKLNVMLDHLEETDKGICARCGYRTQPSKMEQHRSANACEF